MTTAMWIPTTLRAQWRHLSALPPRSLARRVNHIWLTARGGTVYPPHSFRGYVCNLPDYGTSA